MLSEQLTPSAALHLSCGSVVAANLKTKDESLCIGFNDNNNCNHNSKVKTFQQIRHHYDCNNQKINKLTTSSVVGVKAASATTTTTNIASTATTSANDFVANISAPTTTSTLPSAPTVARTATTTTTAPTTTAATITTSANPPTIPSITTTTNTSISLTKNDSLITKKSIAAPPTQKVINDASGRSAALERAYVHDVYENCEEPSGPIRPRVAQFLGNLDPGSVVCDVGCGSGRYLTQCNPLICTVGVDRCYRLSKVAREKGGEVALCDNLELPFRDESFDAVLSLAVVHHFATTERRVGALRELARILRIGGRVVITVWALEQRHRRFESQDVLIPWQPPKNRNFNYSDEEDADDFLPPYHAYTEDSTNSSRSAGDGDSSSLSSSSPGDSCYSFVRRAIQKLAGGRKHPWFLDSWASKDTKNDSSLDYEDARDLPIELRRLEDFEDFPDPPLSAGLKSRSLGSILNPPPRQIVRSRSSVPSLGGPLLQVDQGHKASAQQQPIQAVQLLSANADNNASAQSSHSPTGASGTSLNGTANTRRPKLIKQKQSLCDEDYQLPENPFHVLSSYNSSNNSVNSSLYTRNSSHQHHPHLPLSGRQAAHASLFLRKQSSLNEELMAGNRIREKERVRKRIQKQMSLNEAFLCRSAVFSRRLQVIREGFSTKIKTSTGSLERVTKNGINKIMQNLKGIHSTTSSPASDQANTSTPQASAVQNHSPQQQHHHHHHHHHHNPYPGQSSLPQMLHKPISLSGIIANKFNAAAVSYCSVSDCTSSSTACYCSAYHSAACNSCNAGDDSQQNKPRRSSRESGSDSSKDSSLQSDTSIESEDSFASVIFIPKPEHQHQQQQQLNYQQQHHNSNSSSSNSSSSNGGCCNANANACRGNSSQQRCNHFSHQQSHQQRLSSVPTSPLIMPCPPTPAHSPAAAQVAVTSPPQTVAAVSAAMAILTPPTKDLVKVTEGAKTLFNFDEEDVKQQQLEEEKKSPSIASSNHEIITQPVAAAAKITRQTIKDLPPIPKFRKQQSLQLQRQCFPIVRRSSATACALPSLPKLMSLELFNPATDDLDSDSSEPSSPDSVDSVISAPKLTSVGPGVDELPQSDSINGADVDEASSLDQIIKLQQEQYNKGELSISVAAELSNSNAVNTLRTHSLSHTQPPTCAAFAEQLSAQLQRELDDKNKHGDCRSLECIGDIGDYLDDGMSHKKRANGGETRDLSAFREELRERRLMLANLSTQPSLQHSPTSSSTSSLSSQTRSFTIHEEDEDDEECEEENERSYMLQLYENCKISKFSYKRNRHYNLNPETAYLLQDDGDSSVRDDDEIDDMEHDVILEEEEEDEAVAEASGGDQLGESFKEYGRKNSRNMIKCDNDNRDVDVPNCPEAPTTDSEQPPPLQNHQSTESWTHSNSSTTSLDSPSQGGATTHHRYYHVFREGELDALINHHVASLHIVSSYYERASWCVVAEKVQVWTI